MYTYTKHKTKGKPIKYQIRREGTKVAIARTFKEEEAKIIVDALNNKKTRRIIIRRRKR